MIAPALLLVVVLGAPVVDAIQTPSSQAAAGSTSTPLVIPPAAQRPAELVLAVLRRGKDGWRVVHRRDSLDGNPVVSAALEARPRAIGVHVFEARYQCDDEEPIAYELFSRSDGSGVTASVEAAHLHPYERSWDCGE